MPCRKGSGNEPTAAAVRAPAVAVSAQTRSPPWTFVSAAAATPLTKRAPRGSPRTSAPTVAPSFTSASRTTRAPKSRVTVSVAGARWPVWPTPQPASSTATPRRQLLAYAKGGATLQGGTFAS